MFGLIVDEMWCLGGFAAREIARRRSNFWKCCSQLAADLPNTSEDANIET
jgi:hypothetical protein